MTDATLTRIAHLLDTDMLRWTDGDCPRALGDRCATCGLHGADRVCYRCGAVLHDSICCGGYVQQGMICLACEGDSLRRAARIAQLKRERADINMSIRGTQERLRELEGDLDAVEWELRQARD